MANLTKTQKKNRNKFIALLVAIVLVLAAIIYVGYSAFMAKSAFLDNQDFATALATALDKAERKVSKDDLAAVNFLEVINAGETAAVTLGDKTFTDNVYEKYLTAVEAAEKAEAENAETTPDIPELDTSSLKTAEFEVDKNEALKLSDMKYFSGVEVITVSGVDLDAETLKSFANVKRATFDACDITDEELAAFAGAINKEAVKEIVFSGASINDWAPLSDISDKVTISGYNFVPTEDGSYTVGLVEQTLTEYLAEQAAAEEEAKKLAEEAEKTAEGEGEGESLENNGEENADNGTNE